VGDNNRPAATVDVGHGSGIWDLGEVRWWDLTRRAKRDLGVRAAG